MAKSVIITISMEAKPDEGATIGEIDRQTFILKVGEPLIMKPEIAQNLQNMSIELEEESDV